MKLKKLIEQRNEKLTKLTGIMDKAKEETRAFTTEEQAEFDSLNNEIESLTKTINSIKAAEERSFEDISDKPNNENEEEIRAFEEYIRNGVIETRANFTKSENGAIIPTSIANKIIEEVKDRCPIWNMTTQYNVKGTLQFPVWDETDGRISMAYADEFGTLTGTKAKFTSVELTGFLGAALATVSKSLINNAEVDVASTVIEKVGQAVSDFFENKCLNGDSKITGLSNCDTTNITKLTPDELIDLQESIPDVYQGNAIWIMSRETRKKIRKFKDSDGNYLLNRDAAAKWNYTLLGKDVYISEFIDDDKIYYGDMSGLYSKITENEIEVLREKYAEQHAIGVIAWTEVDIKLVEKQKIKALKLTA